MSELTATEAQMAYNNTVAATRESVREGIRLIVSAHATAMANEIVETVLGASAPTEQKREVEGRKT